jgi:acyl transferase domain-containing protein/acyl carrier protein
MNPYTSIAIVGMSAAFPGAPDIPSFWRVMEDGTSHFSAVPAERWDHDEFYGVNSRDWSRTYAKTAGWLDDVRFFAPQCFGIPPRRARLMDPQQRLILKHSRLAIEDAGLAVRGLPRSTGVYIGACVSEYRDLVLSPLRAKSILSGAWGSGSPLASADENPVSRVAPIQGHTMVGVILNMIACNVSEAFDLRGPAMAMDAACSSGLLAVHEAVLHLRSGICDAALAGGVYNICTPDSLVMFSRIGALSKSGNSRPFDESADGFVLGEGVGVVVLKRLEDAWRDGDRIWGVIRGIGLNNDGRSEGPMTPRIEGQLDVLERAYRDGGVSPGTVGYIEAHGTATPVGDRTEIAALKRHFRENTEEKVECAIGSVKGNFGHTIAAAGMAGLMRGVLALTNRTIPPQAGLISPRREFDLEGTGLSIPGQKTPFEAKTGAPRRVGVNALAFGGTNVHLVLEEAPEAPSRVTVSAARPQPKMLFVISAMNRELLSQHLSDVHLFAESTTAAPSEIAYTLTATRPREKAQVAFFASGVSDLRDRLAEAKAIVGGAPASPAVCFVEVGMEASSCSDALRLAMKEPASEAALRYPGALPVSVPSAPVPSRKFWVIQDPASVSEEPLAEPPAFATEPESAGETPEPQMLAIFNRQLAAVREQMALLVQRAELLGLQIMPLSVSDSSQAAGTVRDGAIGSALRSKAHAEAVAPDEWFYEVAWKPEPLPEMALKQDGRANGTAAQPLIGEKWLVFADRGGVGEGFAEEVRRRGGEPIVIRHGAAFSWTSEGEFVLGGVELHGQFERLLREAGIEERQPVRIAYLWALDLDSSNRTAGARGIREQIQELLLGIAQLCRACVSGANDVHLWAVTRGAQRVTANERMALAQAPLWGFYAAAALEQPELWRGIVDLDPEATAGEPELLLRLMTAADAEDRLAVREGSRWVTRLRPGVPPQAQEIAIRPDATYVVTGAFGGIGMEMAEWLVRRGATHLVLLSRSGLRPGIRGGQQQDAQESARRAVKRLEEEGARVLVQACDIADERQVRELFATLAADWPPVKGILHAAAEVVPKPVIELGAEDFEAAFRSKVDGSLVLDSLTRHLGPDFLALDFLVFFSSASASVGARTLGAYAAANSFMDALAEERRSRGVAGLSVQWGLLSRERMQNVEGEQKLVLSGFDRMDIERAMNALGRLAARGRAQQMVAQIDLPVLKAGMAMRGRRAFFEELGGRRAGKAAGMTAVAAELSAMRPPERMERLTGIVLAEVRRVYGWGPEDAVDPLRGFIDMGFDSLMSVQLKNYLQAVLQCALPDTLTLTYPNVRAVVEFLDVDLFGSGAGAPIEAATVADKTEHDANPIDIEAMSDAEVLEALAAELELVRSRFDE